MNNHVKKNKKFLVLVEYLRHTCLSFVHASTEENAIKIVFPENDMLHEPTQASSKNHTLISTNLIRVQAAEINLRASHDQDIFCSLNHVDQPDDKYFAMKCYQLGLMFLQKNLKQEAINELVIASRLFPENVAIYPHLAMVQAECRLYDDAITTLKKLLSIIELDPNFRDSVFLDGSLRSLGKLYQTIGDTENSVAYYKKFLDLQMVDQESSESLDIEEMKIYEYVQLHSKLGSGSVTTDV